MDHFEQIQPKVLIAVDGCRYGEDYERTQVVERLQREIPNSQKTGEPTAIFVKVEPEC